MLPPRTNKLLQHITTYYLKLPLIAKNITTNNPT